MKFLSDLIFRLVFKLIEKSLFTIIKMLFGFIKLIILSVFKLTIKGNAMERILLMAMLTIDYICYTNGYYLVRIFNVLLLMIIGGIKK